MKMGRLNFVSEKVLIIIAFSLVFATNSYASTRHYWRMVEKAQQNGLPKTEIKYLNRILKITRQQKDYGEWLKALSYKIVIEATIQGNKPEEKVKRLKKEFSKADPQTRPLLEVILAEWYWQYYNRNRYRFIRRTSTGNVGGEDFTTWDIRRIFHAIDSLYQDVLKEKEVLTRIPIEDFLDFLEPGNTDLRLRPTLYDFIANEAIDFYSRGEQSAVHPEDVFEIDDTSSAFGPLPEFLEYTPITEDTSSYILKAIRIYQSLLKYHLRNNEIEAVVDLDLRRLRYIKNISIGEEKNKKYIKRLEEIIDKYKRISLSSLALYYLAKERKSEGRLLKAYKIAEKGYKRFPDSPGGKFCKTLMTSLTSKYLYIVGEKYIPPGTSRMHIRYKNFRKLYFRIYKDRWDRFTKEKNREPFEISEREIKRLLSKKPYMEWQITLPETKDLNVHTSEVDIPKLKTGFYRIFVSWERNFRNSKMVQHTWLWVSPLTVVKRNKSDTHIFGGFVLNAITGEPIKDAVALRIMRTEKRNENEYEYRYKYVDTTYTDSNGIFEFKIHRQSYWKKGCMFIKKGDDIFLYPDYFGSGFSDMPRNRTFFFTDRSIYRPGQTIYFKGICVSIDKKGNNYKVLPNHKVSVSFYDVNGKEISKTEFITNEFGSFSGHFIAPVGRLTGRMTISAKPSGSISFRVEEYKRPKFTVKIEKPEKAFRINQMITVVGSAMTYTGAPVDNASVKYNVVRRAGYPYWWEWYYSLPSSRSQLITHGRTKTDKYGRFKITFFAAPDRNISPESDPRFIYSVYAEVISPDGETHSKTISIVLGYSALAVKLSTKGLLQDNKTFRLEVSTQTLGGTKIPGNVLVRVFRLKEPPKPIRKEFWHINDSTAQFTSNWRKWPEERKVYEKNVSIRKHNPGLVKLKLPTGLYKIECASKDKFGKEVKAFLPVMVLPDWNEKRFRLKLPSIAKTNMNTVEVGESLRVLWGTGYNRGRCFIEIEQDGKIIKHYWTPKGQTQYSFDLLATEALRGGFTVHITYVKENRGYIYSLPVYVPWDNKKLNISLVRFSNKLTPGKDGKILLKVKGKEGIPGTELVAAMYDYSLDQFYPHSWDRFNFFKKHYSRIHQGFINDANGFRIWHSKWNKRVKYPDYSYIQFPKYVTYNFLYYEFPGIGGRVSYIKYKGPKRNKGKFIGRVVDARTGKPLPFVNVIIQGTGIGAVTDRQGKFTITDVPAGTYTVKASMIGYRPAVLNNVRSLKNMDTVLKIRMSPAVLSSKSKTVVVRARKIIEPDVTSTTSIMPPGPLVEGGNAIKTHNVKKKPVDMRGVVVRRQLNETAFFYPHLTPDRNGYVKIRFKAPEALTKWKFMVFAHGKKCENGVLDAFTVTQKDLMVQPNPPRFLRQTDTLYFTAKVINISGRTERGKVQLNFKDIITKKSVNTLLGLSENVQSFRIAPHTSRTFFWRLAIPEGIVNPISYTVVARARRRSDGESGVIPVLSSRVYLTESFPLYIRGHQTKKFSFDRLKDIAKSKTLEPYRFTIQMSSNPAWYAIQALPYLNEPIYVCSEAIFNQYYANSISRHIVVSDPRIKEVFDRWRETNALKSNLEKNQRLKSVLLAETPWVVQAENETQAKKNIALLFDKNNISNNLNSAFWRLKEMQLSNGSWPWFPGGPSDPYITLYIATGFGRLRHLGIDTDIFLALRSISYLDNFISEIYRNIEDKSLNHLTPIIAFYLYGRSFFLKDKPISPVDKEAVNYFLEQAEKNWLKVNSRLCQGYLALALNRFGRVETAKKIMSSIKERSVQNEEMGMFWRETELSMSWFRAPIETQSLMIEAFLEVMNDTTAAEECKVWLLKQKQTQHWPTSKGTADAVYALILRGKNPLSRTKLVDIKLGGKYITPWKVEPGTGFYEKIYNAEEINPQFSRITVSKKDEGIAWGGAYFQYFQEMSKITPHKTNLQITKKIFVNRRTKKGEVMEPVNGVLRVGDLITVRIILKVDRDMEYVHLKDMRGSGFEPVDVLSGYHYQDGLWYYQSTKDIATHFFIGYLPKGTYVFEYNLRVQHKGCYQTGIAEIQCMYAPEFTSHSQSQWVRVN